MKSFHIFTSILATSFSKFPHVHTPTQVFTVHASVWFPSFNLIGLVQNNRPIHFNSMYTAILRRLELTSENYKPIDPSYICVCVYNLHALHSRILFIKLCGWVYLQSILKLARTSKYVVLLLYLANYHENSIPKHLLSLIIPSFAIFRIHSCMASNSVLVFAIQNVWVLMRMECVINDFIFIEWTGKKSFLSLWFHTYSIG